MGSSYVNTLVACDSSFMIQSLKEFHIPGIDYTFSINTTHVAMLLVSIFILIMAIVARVKINKVKPDDTPGMFQNAIEIIVEMLGTMVDGIMGKNANKFVNYISTLFLFIIISNISGLFGLRPPTADYGVTLCLGLITFILVQFNGIKKNKVGHFTALFQPIWFLFPINLIGEFAVPLSLSLRLFGNVMSGTVLMGLIYDLLKPFTIGYPGIIAALYEASASGVKIDLIVRGICCLRVGIPGVSENISVRSIVGNFLEHSRIFYFYNDGNPEVFMGSADWMPRNLDRRVEIVFPVIEEELKEKALHILHVELEDNVKARVMQPDGTYEKLDKRGKVLINSQEQFCAEAKAAVPDQNPGNNQRLFIPAEPAE